MLAEKVDNKVGQNEDFSESTIVEGLAEEEECVELEGSYVCCSGALLEKD
jgi:hypothetical protein